MKAEGAAQGVYVIQCRYSGRVKIGWALHIAKRVKLLNAMTPYGVRVLTGIVGASRKTEFKMHEKFAHLRRHGEWFDLGADLVEHLYWLRRAEVFGPIEEAKAITGTTAAEVEQICPSERER